MDIEMEIEDRERHSVRETERGVRETQRAIEKAKD